ncbi:hypothetical protein F5X96DRAFT_662729 [Biscogniauxia mediterranea]|nr:hypothetical protein F5X96DRAFT_662729 [Biscogniauxia mediterranea]
MPPFQSKRAPSGASSDPGAHTTETMATSNDIVSRRAAYLLLGAFQLAIISTMYECFFRAHAEEGFRESWASAVASGVVTGVLLGLYVCHFLDLVFPVADPVVMEDSRDSQVDDYGDDAESSKEEY